MNHRVLIDNHTSDLSPADQSGLEALILRTLDAVGAPPSEVSLLLAPPEEMRRLNRQYRQIDAPTDVLSFSQVEGDQGAPGWMDAPRANATGQTEPPPLGDVVICPEEIARRAREAGREAAEELRRAVVHGCLHLAGSGHGTEAQARAMRSQEDLILAETEGEFS